MPYTPEKGMYCSVSLRTIKLSFSPFDTLYISKLNQTRRNIHQKKRREINAYFSSGESAAYRYLKKHEIKSIRYNSIHMNEEKF